MKPPQLSILKKANLLSRQNFTRSNIGLMLLSGLLILSVLLLMQLKKINFRKKMITQINGYLTVLGIPPEMIRTIISQAAHETNYFQSDVFKNSNNLFGMKAHSRKVTGKLKEKYNGYSTYTDITGSCNDLLQWLTNRNIIDTAEEITGYAKALKKHKYYEDTEANYTAGMIRAYKRLFSESANKY